MSRVNIDRWHRLAPVAVLLVLVATLTGCGGGDDDTPAICSSVDSLESSVAEVGDIDIDADALATLQEDLDQVQSDLSQVLSDAQDEYADEVDSVDDAASLLGTTLEAAAAEPTGDSLAAVAAAIKALDASLGSLVEAVKSSC